MGFNIKKSYQRDGAPLDSFYCRIEMYVVDRLAGTAYALVQYFKDAELAKGYQNKYTRESHSPSLAGIDKESFPLLIDEKAKINGVDFKLEPDVTDWRVSCYGFYIPLGELVQEEKHEFETVDVEIQQKYVDFDDDGNPVQKTKLIPSTEQRIVNTELVQRCIINVQLPEFQQNPYEWLYVKIKPELEKIFGEGSVEDHI